MHDADTLFTLNRRVSTEGFDMAVKVKTFGVANYSDINVINFENIAIETIGKNTVNFDLKYVRQFVHKLIITMMGIAAFHLDRHMQGAVGMALVRHWIRGFESVVDRRLVGVEGRVDVREICRHRAT
jgi:hypothetical protein